MCHNIECIILLIRCRAALRGFPLSGGQFSLMPHQPHGAQCPPRRNGRADGYILEARTGPSDMSSSFEIPTARHPERSEGSLQLSFSSWGEQQPQRVLRFAQDDSKLRSG